MEDQGDMGGGDFDGGDQLSFSLAVIVLHYSVEALSSHLSFSPIRIDISVVIVHITDDQYVSSQSHLHMVLVVSPHMAILYSSADAHASSNSFEYYSQSWYASDDPSFRESQVKSQINVSSVSGGIELGKTKCTYRRFNRKSSKPYISKDAVSWRQRQSHHHLCRISSFLNNIYQILTPPPTSTLRPTLRSTCHLKICLHSSLIFTSKQIIPFVLFRLMFCRPSQY